MNKKDLKSGMTVKLRNGEVCLVINNFIADNKSFMYFTDFDDNLVCIGDYTHLDIVEVYQFINPMTRLHATTLTTLLDLTILICNYFGNVKSYLNCQVLNELY